LPTLRGPFRQYFIRQFWKRQVFYWLRNAHRHPGEPEQICPLLWAFATGLYPEGERSAATFHDGAAHWPQPRHVRPQAIRDRVVINLLPAETRRVVAARALLLRRALMLAQGSSRQDQDRQHGDDKSSYHPILLDFQSASQRAPLSGCNASQPPIPTQRTLNLCRRRFDVSGFPGTTARKHSPNVATPRVPE
jgi:hypothetical protein